jgi:sec-independent protein translocase protein TatC
LHCNNNYLFNELWHKDGRLGILFTLNSLSKYGESKLETFLEVNDFITFALQFILGFGILLQLLITSDGSGVTMWFVALPMIALYAGIITVRRNGMGVILR